MRENHALRLTTDARYLLLRIDDHDGRTFASSDDMRKLQSHEKELVDAGYAVIRGSTWHINEVGRAAAGMIRSHYENLRKLNGR
jgi:hypothetical protein